MGDGVVPFRLDVPEADIEDDYHRRWGSGYAIEQSTRPQSLGYGLVDSPAGLLGWIVEKFWAWSDCDGDPAHVFTREEMLDNIMLYWLPGTGASAARLYWESFGKRIQDPVCVRPAPPSFRRRSIARPAGGPNRSSATCATGTNFAKAGISPRWSSLRR